MLDSSIAAIRKDYASRELLEAGAAAHPMQQFQLWWNEALESRIDEVNAMTLATASADGMPAARIVLLKSFDVDGFVFFTNYQSYKAMQLAENPRACLVFFWKELERQVRVTGIVEKVKAADSDEYFRSRPEGSRIGAWTSPQSLVIPNREWLEEAYAEQAGVMAGTDIPRPEFWGGYVVRPIIVEFWQGRPSRLHDRLQYTLDESGAWKRERLAP
ncbi:MAG: pyridoxamine 5'-phosphate oxidase [Chitinophagaceae bacterium]|nr:MAG: pyridoxamine 5'-phosphate oxidase [Chitinophagaceae bacterium]